MSPNEFVLNWSYIQELIEDESVPNAVQNIPLDMGVASIILIGVLIILAILFTLVVTSE